MEIHRSARKHGYSEQAIFHAVDNAIVVVDLQPEADPPRVLAIGPDFSGNLLEVIWLELNAGRQLVIHSMALRPGFFKLLLPLSEE